MTQVVTAQLLRQVLDCLLPDRVMTNQTQIGVNWLKNVWLKLIQGNDVSSDYCDLPLLPKLIEGNYNSSYRVQLVNLSSNFLLLQDDGNHVLNKTTCDCLEILNIQIIPKLPDWLPLTKIRSFVSTGSYDDIRGLLDRLVSSPNFTTLQTAFNRDVSRLNVTDFADFLSHHETNLKQNVWNFVAELRLFASIELPSDSDRISSVRENNYFIDKTKLTQFPEGVKLPYRCLKIESRHCTLVRRMGACELTVDEFMEKVLNRHTCASYNDETGKLVSFFLTNLTSFSKPQFIETAKNIRFLWNGSTYCRPNELFDSSDRHLADLFMGMNMFPLSYSYIRSLDFSKLRQFGLKTLNDIQSKDIVNIASKLDSWSRQSQEVEYDIERNAKALMRLLENNPKFLQDCHGTNTVGACLQSLSWVPVKVLDERHYPSCLPSYRHPIQLCKPSDPRTENWIQVVGSTVPIVEASEEVATYFEWNSQPPTSKVIEQLQYIRRSCSAVEHRPDILPLLRSVYGYMAVRQSEFLQYQSTVADEELIWTDDGFKTPANVVINHDQRLDVNIQPYISYIPQEFHRWTSLFEAFGCHLKQSFEVLVNTLKTIKDKYENGMFDVDNGDIDRKIVVNILVRLAEIKKASPEFDSSQVLMMIHDDDYTKVRFAALDECVYDDDEEFLESTDENDCSRKYVHQDVRLDVAKSLGVQSLTKRSLLDTEDVELEEWGQNENLTSRLHTLLHEGYTDGLSVLKEMIQNADDAGASTVKLLYDERMNGDARRRLFSPSLADFQGPSLLVYNDAMFTADDMRNITKLNGATKKEKTTTIGKFGLGFCSVYNLTDIPSFVSGKHLVLFDPHESHIEDAKSGTGLKVNLSNRTLVKRHADQFKPFENVFGCKIIEGDFEEFRGTLFRLPLRTAVQADRSKISNKVYNNEETRSLLNMFVKAVGNTLLFSQNVLSIEIYHLADDLCPSSGIVKCFSLEKSCLNINGDLIPATECKALEKASREVNGFSASHIVKLDERFYPEANRILNQGKLSAEDTVHWLVSWAMPNLSQQKQRTGALPLAAIASPLDNDHLSPVQLQQLVSNICYSRGHLFCFMPLPLKTDLHFHINGCFEVRSDRRELMASNEDDIISNKSSWNDLVLGATAAKAFIDHLLYISQKEYLPESYSYDLLWPKTVDQHTELFVQEFYRQILLQYPAVFKGHKSFVSFEHTLLLDPNIEADIRTIGREMIISIPIDEGKQIIKVETDTLALMNKCNPSKGELIKNATISLKQLLSHFLQNITHPFFESKTEGRNVLLRCALGSGVVDEMLQSLQCIPTEPAGCLEKICGLVHPNARVSNMFSVEDGRFPSKQLIDSSTQVLCSLVRLGMNENFLTEELLIDRAQSIELKSRSCPVCTLEQITNLMRYLGNIDVMPTLDEKVDMLSQLRSCYLLPVKQRPDEWAITWRGDIDSPQIKRAVHNHCWEHQQERSVDVCIAQPTNLFRSECLKRIGAIEFILDDTFLIPSYICSELVLNVLQVKNNDSITLDMVFKQLQVVSDEWELVNESAQLTFGKCLCEEIYQQLHKYIDNAPQDDVPALFEEHKETLSKPIILVGKVLVRPACVVKTLETECQPDFYKLPPSLSKYYSAFKVLGLRDKLPASVIIDALSQKKFKWAEKVLNSEEVKNIGSLLLNLSLSLKEENLQFSELGDDKAKIVAPDTNGYLVETQRLSLDDRDFETETKVRLLHGNCVMTAVANAVGVKSKKEGVVRLFSKMMHFGQKEKLSTRLNGLLNDYPCDESIMKELIQNADDAGATEICFIKHFETRKLKRPLGSEEYQGPALCVYNNSYFTEADFQGIQNLGIGSKSDDPLKTGQYGLGFNAVYHLTDVPSFLSKAPGQTGGDLCIFDPLGISIAEHISEQSPGLRCDVNEMAMDFKDFLEGYNLIKADQYTLFRLPLRTESSAISNECITIVDIQAIIEDFSKEMKDCLHFLKNISCIKIMSYEAGNIKEEYSVSGKLSEENRKKRKSFFDKVAQVTQDVGSEKEKLFDIEPFSVEYTMHIDDTTISATAWLVAHRFGFSKNNEMETKEKMKKAFEQKDLGLLPLAGVSIQIGSKTQGPKTLFISPLRQKKPVRDTSLIKTDSKTEANTVDLCKSENNDVLPRDELSEKVENTNTNFKHIRLRHIQSYRPTSGKTFCFLPLPGCNGLPFNVNGHFAVDRARRHLSESGNSECWNKLLLQDIAVEAVHAMLVSLQSHFIKGKDMKLKKVNMDLTKYDSAFPMLENAANNTWKFLVKQFYAASFKRAFEIYPYVTFRDTSIEASDQGDKKQVTYADVRWTRLAQTGNDFDGGICNIYTPKDVVQFLRTANIKMIHSSIEVKQMLIKCDMFSVVCVTSEIVMDVMKSDKVNACGKLEETTFSNFHIFRSLLRYICRSKEFNKEIRMLPLNLGNDGILRKFNGSEAVICSKWCELLPGSSRLFLHKDIVSLFCDRKELFAEGILKMLTLSDLEKLLPETLPPDQFQTESEYVSRTDECNQASNAFIFNFFRYIYEMSLVVYKPVSSGILMGRYCPPKPHLDLEQFQKILKSFGTWSLLPSKLNDQSTVLVPINRAYTLLVDSGGNDSIYKILQTMDIPTVDHDVFDHPPLFPVTSFPNDSVLYALKLLMACTGQSDILLQCLHSNSSKIHNISRTDAAELLYYFQRNLSTLKKKLPQSYVSMLRSLPLYETIGGKLRFIEKVQCRILLERIPIDGLQRLKLDNYYLGGYFHMDTLFKELGVSELGALELYAEIIMPMFKQIPREFWMCHIKFLESDLMLTRSGNRLDSLQSKIVEHLRDVPFIKKGEDMKCASDFYDEEHPVFKCMLTEDKYLPDGFKSWKLFLEHIGYNTHPTGNMILEYTKAIAQDVSLNGVTSNVCMKCSTILKHILSHWNSETNEIGMEALDQIKTVKFLIPHQISERMKTMFKPHVGDSELISFYDSVCHCHESICWTSTCMLSEEANPNDVRLKEILGILDKPRMADVIKHTHNVSDSIRDNIARSGKITIDQKSVMTSIYTYFQENCGDLKKDGHKLQYTPLVMISDEDFVPADNVVLVLSQEIKPYLYKLPDEYSNFQDVFMAVGAKKEVNVGHYFAVLTKIHTDSRNSSLPPNKMDCVRMALGGLLNKLRDHTSGITCANINSTRGQTLYAPDKTGKMKPARSLVVSDNDTFEDVLRDANENVDWFVGFKELQLNTFKDNRDYIEALKNILEENQPSMLSDIVNVKVCMDGLIEIPHSEPALKWERFLKSEEFIMGIIRVLRPSSTCDAEKVASSFSNVRVKEVRGLSTYMWFRGRRLETSHSPKSCFVTKDANSTTTDEAITYTLYFQPTDDESVSNTLRDSDGIYKLIEFCTESNSLDHSLIEQILLCIDKPRVIKRKLDMKKIPAIAIENLSLKTFFPLPGTYVEQNFFPFLVHSITPFKEYEYRYLALDVSGDDDEDDEAYIYVHILEEMPHTGTSAINISYKVDVGERGLGEPVTVPIYQLYRFVPQTEDTGTEIQLYDSELTGSLPFDENCKRVREMLKEAWTLDEKSRKKIIRRLLLRWHPDKNKGHEEYATRIFNYIKEVIVKLEQNEPIDGMVNNNTGRSSPNMSGSRYEHFSNRCGEQARAHQRAYHDNYRRYCRSTRSGQYAHNQMNEKVCSKNEAKRWHRQAKYDFSTAKAALDGADETKGYNWICYNCHQSCEKALKAVWFFTDANRCPSRLHDLSQIAQGLEDDELQREVTRFEAQTATHGSLYFRLRYPDSVASSSLPADVYTEDQARDAIEITMKILSLVDNRIN